MDGLTRDVTELMDAHAENFSRLRNVVLDPLEVIADRVLRTEARLKSHSSVWRHIDREEDVASLLDLTGFRVITFYEDDTSWVVSQILPRFSEAEVVEHNKPTGYRSTHLRVRLTRTDVDQYALSERAIGLAFEIQVRSAMQHLWAALERQFQYDSDSASEVLLSPFISLAMQARAFDDELVRVRDLARSEQLRGAQATQPGAEAVPIDVETLMGAIAAGGAPTQYDSDMLTWRQNSRGLGEPNRTWIARAASMFRHLGFGDLRATLASLAEDTGFKRWLEVYCTRDFVMRDVRPVRRGDTLVLFAQFLAAQEGREALEAAFRAAGVESRSMVNRLYDTVQLPYATDSV